jgi:hypothetical protein
MKARTLMVAVLAAVAAAGCCARRLSALDGQLESLHRTRQQAGASAATDAKLAALAADARRGASECGSLAPSFYRVGAVAAWQAGDAGASLVGPISSEGAAACAALPEARRPARDCALIRVAQPMAVQDALTRRQATFRRTLEQAPSGKLPAAARAELLRIVQGYRAPFEQLTAIRRDLDGPGEPAGLAAQVDRQRVTIYCNALATWSLLGDVEGATMRDLAAARKTVDALEASLRADGVGVAGPDACRAGGAGGAL